MKIFIRITLIIVIFGIFVIIIFNKKDSNLMENNKIVYVSSNKPLLKQFVDLRINDFKKYPIWVQCHVVDYDEEWYEETDEETFRPYITNKPVNPENAMFLIKSKFILKDGTTLFGFITPQNKNIKNTIDLGIIQPIILLDSGEQIYFWFGIIPPKKKQINNYYKTLKKSPDDVFPINFKIDNNFSKGISSGLINGFYYKKDKKIIIIK